MHNFTLTNLDTDSISFCKPDFSKFTQEEDIELLDNLNSLFPEEIKFSPDGEFEVFIVLKSKNYIMYDGEKIKIKGSSLKSSTLEPILKQLLNECIECLVFDRQHDLLNVYNKYIDMVDNITDIKPWCTKKSLSPTTFASERKNETDIIDAIKGTDYVSGDRIYLFSKAIEVETGEFYKVGVKKGQPKTKIVNSWCLAEHFDGNYDKNKYYEKIHSTMNRFETIIDVSIFKKKQI